MTGNASDLDRYLRILAGANPAGRLIEIRSATAHGGMRQTFTPATRPDLAARTITRLAASTDVYVGVLLRRRRAGGRHACERSHLAFIEIDRSRRDASGSSSTAPAERSIIASGGTRSRPCVLAAAAGRRPRRARASQPPTRAPPRRRPRLRRRRPHSQAADLLELESTPRRHPSSCSCSSRPAATSSTSSPPASPTPPPIVGQRPRPAAPRPTSSTSSSSRFPPSPTCQRSPAANPTAPAKSAARFTTTATPASSSTTTAGTASACRTGGSIYDFGALLYGLDTRGREFLQLRQRLATELLPLAIVGQMTDSWTPDFPI